MPGRNPNLLAKNIMSTSIVTSYYLKAFDAYPFELAEVEEQLDYALAYDPDHISSLCLKSGYYLYALNWQDEARALAERAMAIDPQNSCAAASLLNCMIEMGDLDEALRFMDYINRKVRMSTFIKYAYMAKIMELKMHFKIALNYYNEMILYAENPEQKDHVDARIKLVKDKRKHQRKLNAPKK